jgi:hypothetical protein
MRMKLPLWAVCMAGLFGTVPAFADEVRFSYTFVDGAQVSGTVEGDLSVDSKELVQLRNLSGSYSGQPDTILKYPALGVLSLDGTGNDFAGFETDISGPIHEDFGFDLSDYGGDGICANCAAVGIALAGEGGFGFPTRGGAGALEAEDFDPARWSATVIPEPRTLELLGLSLAGAALRRASRPH